MKIKFKKFTLLSAVATSFCLMGFLASSAQAGGETKGYPNGCYAYNNNFGGGDIRIASWGTGNDANFTVSYNLGGGKLWGYPAICKGWHWGLNATGDGTFPRKISSVSSNTSYFSFSAGGSNMQGDWAYDIFLRPDTQHNTNPSREIMIWSDNNSSPISERNPYGPTVQNISIDGVNWDLWQGPNTSAGYYVYTFEPHSPNNAVARSGSSNRKIRLFLNWLTSNRSNVASDRNITSGMYVSVIEAGLEVTGGNGWAWMSGNFSG